MERTKIVVISDVHISDDADYSWFRSPHAGYVSGLFEMIARDEEVRELVLLGDIFDLWLYPVHVMPWQTDDIVSRWDDTVIRALRQCAANLPEVCYLNGNHDMTVTSEDIGRIDNRTTPAEYNQKHGNLLHLEHGNSADMFNAPDDSGDTVSGLPLGYFITRLVATADDQAKCRAEIGEVVRHHHKNYLRMGDSEAGESAADEIGKSLVICIIDALTAYAFIKGKPVTDKTGILLPNPKENVTVGTVKKSYHSLFGRWLRKEGLWLPDSMCVTLRRDGLDWYAKKLLAREPARVIVMGHTHHGEYSVYAWNHGKYANSGCWCGSTKDPAPTYIEMDMRPSGIVVSLKQWHTSGTSRTLGTATVPSEQ